MVCILYYTNRIFMKIITCKECQTDFPSYMIVDGVRLNLTRRAFCLKCSPFGKRTKNHTFLIVDGKRKCTKCQDWKLDSEFAIRNHGKNRRGWCKICDSNRTQTRARTMKIKSVIYLGGKCKVCGYNKSIKALQFHHREPSLKSFELSKAMNNRWEIIKPELDKCDLLCANCHSEIH